MKRDIDLVRKILLEIESFPDFDGLNYVQVEGHSDQEVAYHIILLDEAGLIETWGDMNLDGGMMSPKRLTWDGHEFLDAARDDTRWNKAKAQLAGASAETVFFLLRQVLLEIIKSQVLPPAGF